MPSGSGCCRPPPCPSWPTGSPRLAGSRSGRGPPAAAGDHPPCGGPQPYLYCTGDCSRDEDHQGSRSGWSRKRTRSGSSSAGLDPYSVSCDPAGRRRHAKRSALNRIHAGLGLLTQVVAGVGFELTEAEPTVAVRASIPGRGRLLCARGHQTCSSDGGGKAHGRGRWERIRRPPTRLLTSDLAL